MSKIKVSKMLVGQTNTYLIYREGNVDSDGFTPVIFVDPAEQGAGIYQKLKEMGYKVEAILLTHGHFDHITGAEELKKKSGAQIYAYEKEVDVLADPRKNVSTMVGSSVSLKADFLCKDGDILEKAGVQVKVIATAGHTEGGCCFYIEEIGALLSGDTLFEGSVGRTDFPTGSMAVLVRNVKEKLFVLPEETVVYPGHGPATSIGEEKRSNPFII